MAYAGKDRTKKTARRPKDTSHADFDINQFELALINRALKGEEMSYQDMDKSIGHSPRILRIQKRNLSVLLKGMGRPRDEKTLESALRRILSGQSALRLQGKAPKHDR